MYWKRVLKAISQLSRMQKGIKNQIVKKMRYQNQFIEWNNSKNCGKKYAKSVFRGNMQKNKEKGF